MELELDEVREQASAVDRSHMTEVVSAPDATVMRQIGMSLYEEVLRHYDHPANGDLHEVVPGKPAALKGPVDLPDGRAYHGDAQGARSFSPAIYANGLAEYLRFSIRTIGGQHFHCNA